MGGRNDHIYQTNLHEDRKRHERELAIGRNLQGWLTAATRFLVLANAGAAAATLAFIGAVLAPSLGKPNIEANIPASALCALSLFIAGVGMTGFVILGQLQKSWQEWITSEFGPAEPTHSNWVGRISDWAIDKMRSYHSPLLFLSFLSFLAGSTFGIVALS